MRHIQIYLLAALMLTIVGTLTANAAYTIDPKSASIAVTDVTDISRVFTIYNTWDNAVLDIFPSVYIRPYNPNITLALPLPQEFVDSVTIIPSEQQMGPNSTATFTMHLSLPDRPEIYNNTYEFVIRFNNTDDYSRTKGADFIDVPIRIYLPKVKIEKVDIPFWAYPATIGGAIIFFIIIIVIARRVRRPIAASERSQSSSEWSGMDMHKHDFWKSRKKVQEATETATGEWDNLGDEYPAEGPEAPQEASLTPPAIKRMPITKPEKKEVNGKLPIIQKDIQVSPIKKRYPVRMGNGRE